MIHYNTLIQNSNVTYFINKTKNQKFINKLIFDFNIKKTNMYNYYSTYKSKIRNLWVASKEGDLNEVKYYVEELKGKVNKADDFGNTPLYHFYYNNIN
jgi:hypothetical protein